MEPIDWNGLGLARIDALVHRDRVAHQIGCGACGKDEEAVFWLAVLGWTPEAFLMEAYPEFYGDVRG